MTSDQPSRVTFDLHTNDAGVETLVITFLAAVQQMLVEGFNATVHNTALRIAHEREVMPEGEPWISVSPAQTQDSLAEGVHLQRSMTDLALDNAIMEGNVVQVRVEFLVGIRL